MNHLRVGIPMIGSQSWLGGVSHMELHIKAVASIAKEERPQLFLLITDESRERLGCYQPFIHLFDGAVYIGRQNTVLDVPVPVLYCTDEEELFQHIDFYFPVNFNVLPGRCAASWIHDFQHKYLPELFSRQDVAIRNELCARIANYSRLIFCSSRAVENDFHTFYPESQAITRVLSLRVYPEEEWYNGNPVKVQAKYNLPEHFILCSNQFWMHKNHKVLFAALQLLRSEGQEVHLVCTGGTGDFRSPGYFKELREYLVTLGVQDLVHILGLIPRMDQIQLIRRSLFVVQPSLFEGLGLIVQECQALGKNIVVSDLDVHKEHQYGVYFKRHSAKDLAEKMSPLLINALPGPDLVQEARAREKAAAFAKIYAKEFCALVKTAQNIFREKPQTSPSGENIPTSMALATSLRPNGNIKEQQKVVASWQALGFSVYSVNNSRDIARLSVLFPKVKFQQEKYGKQGKGHLADVVSCLYHTKAAICGIASPYTYLFGKIDEDFLGNELVKSVVYLKSRKLEGITALVKDAEYINSVIFMSKEQVGSCPVHDLFLEEPWWHVWLLLAFLSKRYTLKKLEGVSGYELSGNENLVKTEVLAQGEKVATQIKPPFALNEEALGRYHQLLWMVAEKNTNVQPNENSSQV